MSDAAVNQEQSAFWNATPGTKWVDYQAQLDQQLRSLGDAMLAAADIRLGQRVLDVGCGCGATALEAAAMVGAAGAVTGVDISAPMLARARELARQQGLSRDDLGQVTFVAADAQTDALGQAVYDRVISRFGVMFFDDPVVAFKNMRTALATAGKLAFVCWRGIQENPWMNEPMKAAASHVTLPPPPAPDAPGPLSFADSERVRRILRAAGFGAIRITPCDLNCAMVGGNDLDACVDFMFNIGPLSRIILGTEVDEAAQINIRRAVRDELLPYMTPGGLVMPAAAWIVSAVNA